MDCAHDVAGVGLGLTGEVETRACGRFCRLHWSAMNHAIDVGIAGPGSGPALRAERLPGRLT